MINVFRKENETKAIKDIILRDIRHFRPKLVHWNEGVCCAPIDRSWKMQFSEGLGNFLRPTIPALWRFLWMKLSRKKFEYPQIVRIKPLANSNTKSSEI